MGVVMFVSGCAGANRPAIEPAPKPSPASASLTAEAAKTVIARVFTAAYLGGTTTGAAAAATLRTAYAGEGLRGVIGRAKLAGVQPAVTRSALEAPPPTLLAVSRGSAYPRFILAQTVTSGALPILHLLTSPDAATPYRIIMSVEMVPPATVKPFSPLSQGSALVSSPSGLAVAPTKLLAFYAAQMGFPAKTFTNPPFGADSFAGQLATGAAQVAKAVAAQATFTQLHTVVPDSVYTVRQADGGALVFGAIERTDSFAVKPGQTVNTVGNTGFVRLTGKKVVSRKASITTLEFVVFAVPPASGPARLVAAREQMVAGSGS